MQFLERDQIDGRELKIEKEEEAAKLTSFSQPKKPYQAALKGDLKGMASFHNNNCNRLPIL